MNEKSKSSTDVSACPVRKLRICSSRAAGLQQRGALLHGLQSAIRRNAGPPAPVPGAAGRAGRGLRACSAARGSKKRGSSSLTAWQMLCQIAKRTVRRSLRLAALYGQALDGCKAPGFCGSVRLAPTRRERFRNGSKSRGLETAFAPVSLGHHAMYSGANTGRCQEGRIRARVGRGFAPCGPDG